MVLIHGSRLIREGQSRERSRKESFQSISRTEIGIISTAAESYLVTLLKMECTTSHEYILDPGWRKKNVEGRTRRHNVSAQYYLAAIAGLLATSFSRWIALIGPILRWRPNTTQKQLRGRHTSSKQRKKTALATSFNVALHVS